MSLLSLETYWCHNVPHCLVTEFQEYKRFTKLQNCGLTLIPVSFYHYLPSLHLFGGHYNYSRVLLKYHPPEVADGVLQTALSGNVALLQLGAITLRVQLRLNTHTQKQRKDGRLNAEAETVYGVRTRAEMDWKHRTLSQVQPKSKYYTLIHYKKLNDNV